MIGGLTEDSIVLFIFSSIVTADSRAFLTKLELVFLNVKILEIHKLIVHWYLCFNYSTDTAKLIFFLDAKCTASDKNLLFTNV